MSDVLNQKTTIRLPKIDWVWAIILLSPLFWLALDAQGYKLVQQLPHLHDASSNHLHLTEISQPAFVLGSLLHILPYFAFAVSIGAFAAATDLSQAVNKAFSYNQPVAIALAAIAGGLSPLCSCGVIPLIAAMLIARVPIAPIMAFWLASPLMAPEQYAITGSFLGFEFATAKLLAALTLGAVGGYVTYGLSLRIDLSADKVLRADIMPKSCCSSNAYELPQKPVVWAFWKEINRRNEFKSSAISTTLFLGKWLTLAFVIEAIMLQVNLITPLITWLLGTGAATIPLSALIGIPAYLNGDAAPALVGAFVRQGLPDGAAMAFLIGGGVTCIPAAVAVWSLVRPAIFGLYLSYGLVGAILSGLAYELIL